jgi:hypothetical protein
MPRNDPFSLWFEAAAAMNAAALTIAMRTLKLQQAWLSGDLSGGPEGSRMVMEKIIAAQTGAVRMAFAAASMALTPPQSAKAAQRRTGAIVAAGVRPGFKKARANARRLTRLR